MLKNFMRLDRLPSFSKKRILQVVIETPKGCRNKYDFDPELKIFRLAKTLPEGMVFPFDFGFVPGTRGEDGDPLDVLVLMDEPAMPGCVVPCRLIGLIEAKQEENGRTDRNDRFVAVATSSHEFKGLKEIDDVPGHVIDEIAEFFVNYNRLEGRKFKPLRQVGPKRALGVIKSHRVRA